MNCETRRGARTHFVQRLASGFRYQSTPHSHGKAMPSARRGACHGSSEGLRRARARRLLSVAVLRFGAAAR